MDPNVPKEEVQFVFRRLADSLKLAGKEVDGRLWLIVLVPVLVAAFIYVVWMYRRDGRAVGWAWATLLGAMRCLVYVILALVFLLPANQTWETTQSQSKVVLLMDVSGSMASKDDLPTDTMPLEKLVSRQDKVIKFLSDEQVGFLKRLEERNPVTLYRFGSRLDENAKTFGADSTWTIEDWNAWLKPDTKEQIPAEFDEEKRAELRKKLDFQVALINGTNLGSALLSLLTREANNMLQGVIVVSDGRNTQFSAQTFEEVRQRAGRAKVPIFTVAVGEDRPRVQIRITDLLVPDQARPDDKFKVQVDVDGEGLSGKPVDVTLDVTKPDGTSIQLKPLKAGEFKEGTPPHSQVEFEVDPRSGDASGKSDLEGEWKVVVRVPKDKREIFAGKEHVSDPATIQVVKKPLRILLFAGGATHDYQFARSLFVREVDRRRAELSIYIQLARPEIVQDVPADRLLQRFPDVFSAAENPQEVNRNYNLAQYDLIIAFDPNWADLTPAQLALVEKWVEEGGGLIFVAGPVNTFHLTQAAYFDVVKPILNLCPVLLVDSRFHELGTERSTTDPWKLNFIGATSEMEFLNLDDESKERLSGWDEFFYGPGGNKGGPPRRGFFNYYPLRGSKPGANVIATFADPRAKLPDGREQPFLVSMPYRSGKVFYIGSGELWRLRQAREAFHERFWTKLARFGGSGNIGQLKTRGNIVMGKNYTANNYVTVEARLRSFDMQPLPRTERPKAQIKGPPGVALPAVELQPKPGQGTDWDGWFQGRFLVTVPGNYELQLKIPGGSETLTSKFVVKESNPELDNTSPDFGLLRQTASEATEVLNRIKEDKRAKVKPELDRMNKIPIGQNTPSPEDKETKLFFDLKAAQVIPDCMITDSKTQRSRGPIKDLWDDGFDLPRWASSLLGRPESEPPVKASTVLVVVVVLLSVEWLTRKLLRLA